MKNVRPAGLWVLAVIFLGLVIVAGGGFILISARNNPGLEVTLAVPQQSRGQIYISGAVNNPGIYPFFTGSKKNISG